MQLQTVGNWVKMVGRVSPGSWELGDESFEETCRTSATQMDLEARGVVGTTGRLREGWA